MKSAMILALLAMPVQAQQEDRIKTLLEQLGDEAIEAREKAEIELKKIGPKVLPETRKVALHHPDAEVRARAEQIVKWYTEIRWRADVASALKQANEEKKAVLVFSTVGPLNGYT